MKKILGLDLGVGSVGWALIEVNDKNEPAKIIGMGSRIVPLSTDDANQFSSGNAISKNQDRTKKRTARKCYDRYQMRRAALTEKLRDLQMLPDERLIKLPVIELWKLRADAATKGKKLSLPEIGRVLYHLNQKRGYKHAKADESTSDSNQRKYVEEVNKRYSDLQSLNKTIGQYFYEQLQQNVVQTDNGIFYTFRIKDQVYPRNAYMAEFDQIMECQKEFYPSVLTQTVIDEIRNNIIYYQRGLKSCKHLVSVCEFEKNAYYNKEGKLVYDGPKVAPKSSPLFQVCKIWEEVNALTLRNRKGDKLEISKEQRLALFNHLDNNEKLTLTDCYKILGISKSDGWWGGKSIGRGLQGNTTKMQLVKALKSCDNLDDLLKFNLTFIDSNKIDETTGEIIKVVSPDFLEQPLYKLWHVVYSLQNKQELANALNKQFGINDSSVVDALYKIDFGKSGFGNKSAKFIREILPYLHEGLMYSEACEYIGIRHSNCLTKAERESRILLDKLPQIQRNELRQPVVEKILNQMINVVNALMAKHGAIDEIRVELARELKQSKEERFETDKANNKRKNENKKIEEKIEEFGVRSSRNRIQKYRLWEEAEHKCFYCGQPVSAKEFLEGFDVEVEHIIPKSLLFDDSFSNKVCSCRKCNKDKNNRTAYDFMKSQGESEFNSYLKRVEDYFSGHKISKTKRDHLLMSQSEIPTDFIERQLRQSQYISKKSIEILQQVCHNVWATSGSVTDFLRHTWGYDEILHSLNFNRYKNAGLTEVISINHKGQDFSIERIKDWSKRLDHRHHAIDALTIAETRQGFIQRLNNLNTERDAMFADVEQQNEQWKEKKSLLEKWISIQPHFSTEAVAQKTEEILISFKAGKKAATLGKRILYKNNKKVVAQENIIIPRGALHEEGVYGQIKRYNSNGFEHYIVKKYPLGVGVGFLFSGKETIEKKGKNGVVIENDKIKTVLDSIVDKQISRKIEERLNRGFNEGETYKNNVKKALENLKDLDKDPVYLDKQQSIKIKTVRCFTGLSAVVPSTFNEKNEAVSFVKPGNNHHIALYKDSNGDVQELVVTFWHAVERKKYGVPTIIENPKEIWNRIIQEKMDLPENFLNNLPNDDWQFIISLQQNEMFVLGMDETSYKDAIETKDYKLLNKYLYRVQSVSASDYWFRYHVETVNDKTGEAKEAKKFYRTKSCSGFLNLQPHKIKISLLGDVLNE